ncbi:MAG: AMIN domain-containing protein [Elusimicrobia bacterium]|nr:AMIN domain-containing protein [Elusimicrobiota bacterium]
MKRLRVARCELRVSGKNRKIFLNLRLLKIRYPFLVFGLAFLALNPQLATRGSFAAETWRAATKLSGIEMETQKIRVHLDGKEAKYKAFAVSRPPKVILEFYDTWVPAGFAEKFKAPKDSSGLIEDIRVAQFASAPESVARVVVDLGRATPFQTQETEGLVTLFLDDTGKGPSPKIVSDVSREPAQAPAAPSREPARVHDILAELPGSPIDVNFQDVDMKIVLTIMIEKLEALTGSKVNLITASDVSGMITLKLKQTPFREVWQTVLSMKQMVALQTGSNVIKVMGPNTYLAEKQQAITFTRIFVLNYIAASEMKTHLDAIRQLEGRKGNILIANDINALIVVDTEDGLLQTAKLIKELDARPKAVSIEAKVIDLQIDKALDYGIEWQYAKSWDRSSGDKVDRQSLGSFDPNSAEPIGGADGVMPDNPLRLSLPAGGTAVTSLGFAFGRVTNTSFLTTALTLAAREGKLKVLSNPKIVTLNNQPATISAGSQVPTVQTTVSPGVGTTQSVSYLSVGVMLAVTPVVTSDGYIRMKITPTVSQVGSTGGIPGLAPAINSRTASTTLIVKDGETAVIGGLITELKDRQTTKVPFLGDLPLIGWIFRRTSLNEPRTELLVFVTPKIVD